MRSVVRALARSIRLLAFLTSPFSLVPSQKSFFRRNPEFRRERGDDPGFHVLPEQRLGLIPDATGEVYKNDGVCPTGCRGLCGGRTSRRQEKPLHDQGKNPTQEKDIQRNSS